MAYRHPPPSAAGARNGRWPPHRPIRLGGDNRKAMLRDGMLRDCRPGSVEFRGACSLHRPARCAALRNQQTTSQTMPHSRQARFRPGRRSGRAGSAYGHGLAADLVATAFRLNALADQRHELHRTKVFLLEGGLSCARDPQQILSASGGADGDHQAAADSQRCFSARGTFGPPAERDGVEGRGLRPAQCAVAARISTLCSQAEQARARRLGERGMALEV